MKYCEKCQMEIENNIPHCPLCGKSLLEKNEDYVMELKMYELAEQLKQLREEKKDAEQRVKDINAEIDKTEYALVQLMAKTETQNFTRAGTMFSLTTKTRASAVAGHKDELYSALKENGFGELVYETVNANSLSAFG